MQANPEMQQQIGSDAFGAAPTLLISVLAGRRFTVASLRYARRALRNQCARKVLAPRLFKLGEHFIVPHSGHNKMLRVPRAIGPGSTITPLFGASSLRVQRPIRVAARGSKGKCWR